MANTCFPIVRRGGGGDGNMRFIRSGIGISPTCAKDDLTPSAPAPSTRMDAVRTLSPSAGSCGCGIMGEVLDPYPNCSTPLVPSPLGTSPSADNLRHSGPMEIICSGGYKEGGFGGS